MWHKGGMKSDIEDVLSYKTVGGRNIKSASWPTWHSLSRSSCRYGVSKPGSGSKVLKVMERREQESDSCC